MGGHSKKGIFLGLFLLAAMTAACSRSQLTISNTGDSPQIVGGTDVHGLQEAGFAGHMVALYDIGTGTLCTASVLSHELLLTAAHCLGQVAGSAPAHVEDLRIVFGTNLRSKNLTVRSVVGYAVHPNWVRYQDERIDNGDIALVRFRGGLPQGYKPAPLLKNEHLLHPGREILIAGYGISNALNRSGGGQLRQTTTDVESVTFASTEVLVNQSKGQGACHGDSGGPAYIQVGNTFYLWGITSRAIDDENDTCARFSAYTNILAHKKWLVGAAVKLTQIEDTIKDPPLLALNF